MTYSLAFLNSALREWKKLSIPVREQFKKKLAKCLLNPHVRSSALSGAQNCYKIKLRTVGYRLVYRVFDDRLVVQVVAVGKRDKKQVYIKMHERLK